MSTSASDRARSESLSTSFDRMIAESRDKFPPIQRTEPTHFQFTTNGVGFKGFLATGDNGTRLSLEADLGPLPFSAENNSSRGKWLKLLRTNGANVPDHHLLDDSKRIRFVSETKLDHPLTGEGLLNQLVVTLLSLRMIMYGEPPAPASKGTELIITRRKGFMAERNRP